MATGPTLRLKIILKGGFQGPCAARKQSRSSMECGKIMMSRPYDHCTKRGCPRAFEKRALLRGRHRGYSCSHHTKHDTLQLPKKNSGGEATMKSETMRSC